MARRDVLFSVFVGGIPLDVSENDIRDLFSSCGLIENMYISCAAKNNSKYGFIRYSTPQEVIKAVSDLHRWKINGSRLIVDIASDTIDRLNKYKDAQKNETNSMFSIKAPTCNAKSTEVSKGSSKLSNENYSVYVEDLHQDVTEEELQDLFGSCGCVHYVFIQYKDVPNRYGFIHYSNPEDAVRAVKQFHGTKIRGKSITVELSKRSGLKFPKELLSPHLHKKNSKNYHHGTRLNFFSVRVSNIHSDVTEGEVKDLFSSCGAIQDSFFAAYEDSGKKYGFVRYSNPEHAIKAVTQLHGKRLKNQPITVMYAADTVDRIPKANSTLSLRCKRRNDAEFSVYVGHLHPSATKTEIRDLFSGCGCINDIYINEDVPENRFGFIRFSNVEGVKNAISHLNGWKIKDKRLLVDIAHESVGHLQEAKDLRSIVPSIDPSFCFDEKSANRTSEMNSVINRSRLHETYSLVKSKVCSSKGFSDFNRVFEAIDRQHNSSQCIAIKQDLSPRSKISLELEALCDRIQTGANKLSADIFKDKILEVTRTVEYLMESSEKSPQRSNPQPPHPVSSPTAQKSRVKNLSPVNHNQKTKPLKNDVPLSCVQSTISFPDIKSSPAPTKEDSDLCNSKRQSTVKRTVDTSVLEIDRQLRKQINNANISHQSNRSIDEDETFDCNEENFLNINFPIAESERHFQHPDADENWGELIHSDWAADLFCQILDSKSNGPTQRTGSSECAFSISSESCSAVDTSGYSSFFEGGEADSFLRCGQTNTGQKCL